MEFFQTNANAKLSPKSVVPLRCHDFFGSSNQRIQLVHFSSSVQSIMGATLIRRSIFSREKSPERPIFVGFCDCGVSAGFMGIPGSLSLAEVPYRCHE